MPDRRRRRPVDTKAVTEVLRQRPPRWEGEPPEAPGRVPRTAVPDVSDLSWDTPPLWQDTSETRRLPRPGEEPEEEPPPAGSEDPPPGDRLF
jgi:hypothetical protein